jgi:hypothetical protein
MEPKHTDERLLTDFAWVCRREEFTTRTKNVTLIFQMRLCKLFGIEHSVLVLKDYWDVKSHRNWMDL